MSEDNLWAEVFQYFSAESTKMEPILRSAEVLKLEAVEIGYDGKEVAEYVKKQHQANGLKLYAEEKKRGDEIWMAEIQAEAEKEKRADKIQIQMAQIEAAKGQAKSQAEKELTLK